MTDHMFFSWTWRSRERAPTSHFMSLAALLWIGGLLPTMTWYYSTVQPLPLFQLPLFQSRFFYAPISSVSTGEIRNIHY